MRPLGQFIAATAAVISVSAHAIPAEARDSIILQMPESSPMLTPPTGALRGFKSDDMRACLNRNAMPFMFATFFTQAKGDVHQFPDLTMDGEYLFLDMSDPRMSRASHEALKSACGNNPELNLADYAIHGDYSGVSGPVHKSGVGREEPKGREEGLILE